MKLPAGADGAVEPVDATDADGAAPAVDDDGATEPGVPLCEPPEHPSAISTVTSAMDLNGDPAARIVNP